MRVPLNAGYDSIIMQRPTTTSYPPVTLPPGTSVKRVETKKATPKAEPTPAVPKPDEAVNPAKGAGDASKATNGAKPASGQEEADKKPALPEGEAAKKPVETSGPALGSATGNKGA